MCVLLKYIFFDFDSDTTLKDRVSVLRFFARLVENGEFRLAALPGQPEPASLEQAWEGALGRGPRSIWLRFDSSGGLNVTFGVYGTEWRRWYAMVYDSAIGSPANQNNVRSLVKACEIAYTTLQPDYGYGLVSLENHPVSAPGQDELAALYDYNFLSPRLVEKLGREKALSVPAHRIQTFEDGGILLEMSPTPLLDRKTTRPRYQQAAAILGMKAFRQGGS